MDNQDQAGRVEMVSALLSRTTGAHRQYEIDHLGGERDEEWAKWYAHYLAENGLFDLLGLGAGNRSGSRLQEVLIELDEQQRANAPDGAWEDYYARYLVEHGLSWNE